MPRLRTSLIMAALCASISGPVAAAPLSAVDHHELELALRAAPGESTDARVRALVVSPAYRAKDPTLAAAERVDVKVFRFGGTEVARVRPVVDGVPVEGADRLFAVEGQALKRADVGADLNRLNDFEIAPEVAVLEASGAVVASALTDPTVERVSGLARRVWLRRPGGLVATYRVRVPTLSLRTLADVWVDASTGEVLQVRTVAKFADGGVADGGALVDAGIADAGGVDAGGADAGAPVADAGDVDAGGEPAADAGPLPAAPTRARVFDWWPDVPLNAGDLVEVDLEALVPAEVGGNLVGAYIATANCCKEYVCLNGGSDCEMNDVKAARCATPDDDEPLTSQLAVTVPGNLVPGLGIDELYAQSAFCAELPRATSRAADGDRPAGWFESPVDQPREDTNPLPGLASEEDPFSEVQAYHAATTFFLHVRDLLDDDTFCLREESMGCEADGSPTLGEDGLPARPFRVTTNVLIPSIDVEAIFLQLAGGLGRDPGSPIVVEDYAREDAAVFLPAGSEGPISVPPELSALVSVFNRDFDSILFFQGERDPSYDGATVFHEMGHAVLHTYTPDIDSLGVDRYGAHAAPGAIVEAVADFLAADLTGSSLVNDYAGAGFGGSEIGRRALSNEAACPDTISGDVHDDSRAWSGALWEARAAIRESEGSTGSRTFARVVLETMAESNNDETYERFAQRLIDNTGLALGGGSADAIRDAISGRGLVDCVRVVDIATVSASGNVTITPRAGMAMATQGQVGLDNYAPSPVQLRVEVPAGTPGFLLSWTQESRLEQQFAGDPQPLGVLAVKGDEPIEWTYVGTSSVDASPRMAGQNLAFNPEQQAADMNDPQHPQFGVETEPACETTTYYVSLANPHASAPLLSDITVSFLDPVDDLECAAEDAGAPDAGGPVGDGGTADTPDCGCSQGGDGDTSDPGFALASLGVLGALLARRRRRAR